jgi:predicted N-acetyltransferase YhbS
MIRLRPMTSEDIAAGLALSRQAGWNQTEADWHRALVLQPDGCFVAVADGAVVGSCCVCLFGPVAWVALVLVDAAHRRRGIGRSLMEHALSFLDGQKVASVRLDATPIGQPLYEQLGFVPQFRLARYAGILPADDLPPSPQVGTVPSEHWEELAALDEWVTKTDRRKYLLHLFAEQPEEVRAVKGRLGWWRGWMSGRPGANARQLGPCLGAAKWLLLQDAFRRHAGRAVYIDIPEDNVPACRLVEERGLIVQRHLLRMCRGESVVERRELLWASSGPEKG